MSGMSTAAGGATSPDEQPSLSLSAAATLERIRARLVRPMPDDRLLGWLLPLTVTFLAGIIRFWRLTRPGGHSLHSADDIVFDETYYVHDSWSLLHHGVETTGTMKASAFVVHPPLGKWLMAIGEALFDHGKTVTFHDTIYPASPLAFRFSASQGLCRGQDAVRVARHLDAAGLPTTLKAAHVDTDGATLVGHMAHDKKMEGGRLPFLLARGIGQTFLAKDVDLTQVAAFLDGER